jgi:hypothetical protein
VYTERLGEQGYVHPAVALALLIAAALMLVLGRNQVIGVFLSAGLLIPMDQVVIVGPFHFQMLRMLIFVGWIRWGVGASTALRGNFNVIDKLVLCFAAVDAIDVVVLWDGSQEAIINRCGAVYTIVGLYFLFRILIRGEKDIIAAIKSLAHISAVIALIMLIEQASGTNPYSWLGGPRAWTREVVAAREGRLRAMGPFQHPILAGSFGGVTVPLFFGLWAKSTRSVKSALIGVASASVIVFTSASSTPLMAYMSGVVGLMMWPSRRLMPWMRRCVVVSLVALHLAMKAPVWALIQRVDLAGGSTGYHRYQLLDQFIRRFWEWSLVGVKSTDNWGAFMWDHANEYVAVGTTSGLVPLALFIAIIVYAFKFVGRARKRTEGSRREALFVWALGAAVFANVVAFFGISYYDQTTLVWYCLLSMISAACTNVPPKKLPQQNLWGDFGSGSRPRL